MGGESASCTGCHESKTESYQGVPAGQAEAKPQRLKPFAGVEHPLLGRYEKEGRLASVENYLGVNAPRSFDPQAPIEGFSFERRVQPILDRHCVRCHSPEAQAGNGVKPSKLDLTARKVRRVGDKKRNGAAVQRVFNQSYISLTGNGKPTPTVNWVLQESAPPLQKPYSCGSATSSLTKRLERAHCGTDLTQDEKDTVCAWIDLAVPYCGSYLEGRAWDAEDEEAYARFQRKRVAYAAQELADLRKALNR